jgi:O-methyltransferase
VIAVQASCQLLRILAKTELQNLIELAKTSHAKKCWHYPHPATIAFTKMHRFVSLILWKRSQNRRLWCHTATIVVKFTARGRKRERMMPKLFRRRSKQKTAPLTPDLAVRFPDSTEWERDLIDATQSTTMTSPERLMALIRAIDYVVEQDIPGDVVECGVWRGGSMHAAAKTLVKHADTRRQLWLYDTFEGMPPPTNRDVDFCGETAEVLLQLHERDDPQGVWCVSSLPEVQRHIESTGYPAAKINYVVGPVEETLSQRVPDQISLLRLDTDWYESTRCELEMLFPRLVSGGILIIDDYGHWQGCRQAVDEYFKKRQIKIFLNRIDYTGRIAVKQ